MGQVSLLELKEMLESKSHVELTREDWQLLPFVLDTNLDGHVDVQVRPHSAPVALQSMPRTDRLYHSRSVRCLRQDFSSRILSVMIALRALEHEIASKQFENPYPSCPEASAVTHLRQVRLVAAARRMSVAVDASADADTAGPREEGAQLSFRRGPTPDGRGIGESEGLGRIPRQRLEAHLHGNAAEPGAWPVRCYCRGHARVALALQGVYRDAGRQVGRSVPLWSHDA